MESCNHQSLSSQCSSSHNDTSSHGVFLPLFHARCVIHKTLQIHSNIQKSLGPSSGHQIIGIYFLFVSFIHSSNQVWSSTKKIPFLSLSTFWVEKEEECKIEMKVLSSKKWSYFFVNLARAIATFLIFGKKGAYFWPLWLNFVKHRVLSTVFGPPVGCPSSSHFAYWPLSALASPHLLNLFCSGTFRIFATVTVIE